MVINDAVIVNIYLAFRSHYCFGLRGMKAFLLNFLVRPGGVGGGVRGVRGGRGSVGGQFPQIFELTPGELHEISVGLPRNSAQGNWMEKLAFCAVIVSLCVCFLIVFKGLAVGLCISYVV